MIRLLRGVSGIRPDRSSYQFSCGAEVTDTDYIENDLVRAGLAIRIEKKESKRPIANPPENFAITPMLKREDSVKTIVKRGKKPKNV